MTGGRLVLSVNVHAFLPAAEQAPTLAGGVVTQAPVTPPNTLCKLSVGQQLARTLTVKHSLSPVYPDTMEFTVPMSTDGFGRPTPAHDAELRLHIYRHVPALPVCFVCLPYVSAVRVGLICRRPGCASAAWWYKAALYRHSARLS